MYHLQFLGGGKAMRAECVANTLGDLQRQAAANAARLKLSGHTYRIFKDGVTVKEAIAA